MERHVDYITWQKKTPSSSTRKHGVSDNRRNILFSMEGEAIFMLLSYSYKEAFFLKDVSCYWITLV